MSEKLETIKKEHAGLSRSLKSKKQELNDAEREKQTAEIKLNDLREKDKRLCESIKSYDKSMQQVKQQQQTKESEISNLKGKQQQCENEHKQLHDEKMRLNGVVKEGIRKCTSLIDSIRSGQERLSYLSMNIGELNAKRRECETEKRNLDREIARSKEAISDKKRELAEKHAECKRNEQLVREKQRGLIDKRRTLENTNAKKFKIEMDIRNKVLNLK